MSELLHIGLLLFPKVTQLDFTGPLQVLSRLPGAKIHLVWKRIEPVPSDTVLMLTPCCSCSRHFMARSQRRISFFGFCFTK